MARDGRTPQGRAAGDEPAAPVQPRRTTAPARSAPDARPGPSLTLVTPSQAERWTPFLPLFTTDQIRRLVAQWMSNDEDDRPLSFYLHFDVARSPAAETRFIASLVDSLGRAGVVLHTPNGGPDHDFKPPILAGVAHGWAYELHYARDWSHGGGDVATGVVVMGARLNRAALPNRVDTGPRRRTPPRQRSLGRQRS